MNPPNAGAAYGYAEMGPYRGGQAEYLNVPYGDFNCLRLPEDAEEKQTDYVMLADILPDRLSRHRAGRRRSRVDSVVIYGCGPVGLMAAYSAAMRGRQRCHDRGPPSRPPRAGEEIGVIPIDDSKGDPVEQVLEQTRGRGADRGCECVGWQAHDPQGHEHPNMTLNNLVKSVRATGRLGVVGVFPQDPKSPDKLLKEGEVAFDIATLLREGPHRGLGTVRCEAIQPADSAS